MQTTTSDNVDRDAAALEEVCLSLSLSRMQGRHIDLPERPDELAGALEMTLHYRGGAGATPSQRRQAAAALSRTPLAVLAARRFERRDDRTGEFLLQSCAGSKVRACVRACVDAPPKPRSRARRSVVLLSLPLTVSGSSLSSYLPPSLAQPRTRAPIAPICRAAPCS